MSIRPLLEEDSNGDVRYVGPLHLGKRAALLDRFPLVTHHETHVRVELHDDAEHTSAAEWGAGPTEEEAWRYALGAAFGPMDAEYDEAGLYTLLGSLRELGDPPFGRA